MEKHTQSTRTTDESQEDHYVISWFAHYCSWILYAHKRENHEYSLSISRIQPNLAQAFTAYFLIGKLASFLRCFSVFSDASCYIENINQLNWMQLQATHLAQPPSDSPGLLRSQVQRKIFLVFVVFPEILASFLVCHSQDSGD